MQLKLTNKNVFFQVILFLSILLFIIFLMQYQFGTSDHTEQLPLIKRAIDSNYLFNDWFVNVNSGISVRHLFSLTMAFFTNWFTLEQTYFFSYLISMGLMTISVYLIAYHISRNYFTSFLSIVLLLFGAKVSLGESWLFYPMLLPLSIANSLVIFSFYLILRHKKLFSILALSIATYFHILIGIISTIIALSFFLFSDRSFTNFKKVLYLSGIYLVLCGWTIFPILFIQNNPLDHIPGQKLIEIIGYIRHPWHYIPSQFSLETYLQFFSLLSLLFLNLNQYLKKNLNPFFKFLITTILLFMVIGTVFVEIFPSIIILKLQLFRFTSFLSLIIYIITADYIRIRIQKNINLVDFLFQLIPIFGLISYIPLLLSSGLIFYVFYELFLRGKLENFFNSINPYYQYSIMLLAAISVTIILFYINNRILPLNVLFKSNLSTILAITYISFITIWLIVKKINNKYSKETNNKILLLLTCIVITFFLMRVYLIKDISLFPHQVSMVKKNEAYQWIKNNTPEDSLFITPPYIDDFRLNANRAIVVDFKSFPFSDNAALEWDKRLGDLTDHIQFKHGINRSDQVKEGFYLLNESDILAIAKKYKAGYIFTESDINYPNLAKVYENEKYFIYKL